MPDHDTLSSALADAVIRADISRATRLLNEGADANTHLQDGNTVLHYASWGTNQVTLVEQLISHGADVNARNPDGETPLMLAVALDDNAAVVALLLKNSARPNDQNIDGNTALINAAVTGAAQSLLVMLDHGADTSIRNNRGDNAADTAAQKGRNDILQLIAATEEKRRASRADRHAQLRSFSRQASFRPMRPS